MKNSTFKRIMSTMLVVVLAVAVVFAISSCKKEHVHEFDTKTVAATCTTDGKVVKTCECGEIQTTTIPATGHTFKTVTVESTCTAEGLITNTCACGYVEKETLPLAEHDLIHHPKKYSSCAEPGYHAYDECKNCDYNNFFAIPKYDHVPSAEVVDEDSIVDPTCVKAGSYDVYTYCKACLGDRDELVELTRETIVIPATGHDMQPVAAKSSTCYSVGWFDHLACANGCGHKENYTEIAPYAHVWSEHPVVFKHDAPTCVDDGTYHYAKVCTNDNCPYYDETTYFTVVDPATGHDFVDHDAKAPTCVNNGWEAYKTCNNCDYNDQVIVIATGHTSGTPVEENVVDPTCTKTGKFDLAVYCDTCHEELSRKEYTVPALGHDYVAHDGQAATCEDDGWYAYHTCTRCDYTSYEVIPANGHSWVMIGEPKNFVAPTCTEDGEYDAIVSCTVEDCPAKNREMHFIVDAVGHNYAIEVDAVAPTCTTIGWEAYHICTKCDERDNYVELPALDHDMVHYDYKAPTCLENGWEAHDACSRGDYTTIVEIPATGHTLVYLPAVANGCETDGLTAGQYCTECNDATIAQQVVPAHGHNYDANGICQHCRDKVSVGLTYTLVEGGYAVTGIGSCKDTDIVIPYNHNGQKVVAIASMAFYSNFNITSVTIPDSVQTIGDNAFFCCYRLTTVKFGSGVKSIGDYAFYDCNKLSTVVIGAAQWNQLSIGTGNEKLVGASKQYI